MDASTTETSPLTSPRTQEGPTHDPDSADLERASAFFVSQRARLFRVASRVVGGDAGSAEDVVQEAWLRWQRTDRTRVRNPEAFLTTTTTRLAINVVQSAGRRHERPGDVQDARTSDDLTNPSVRADQTAAVAEALGLLLARLSGRELGAYLLRSVFDYPYDDVARILRTSAVNARQLVRRAACRLADGPVRTPVARSTHRRLVHAFLVAAREGEVAALEELLTYRGVAAAA
ncbi:sigma factor [Isoptericola sp. NPDC056578]|uniref:sigma factor n=1 Tax=unclassified Isoptericola TaxID=2623355 RepID=UPI0036948633